MDRAFNWQLVQWLGEIQLLTKVSYAMIVLVPLLASIWPIVHLAVNKHNERMAKGNLLLREAKEEFMKISDEIKSKATINRDDQLYENKETEETVFFKRSVLDIQKQISEFESQLASRPLRYPNLPWTLAASFFAAIFIALGHLLFQCSPEQVRKQTIEQFVAEKKSGFAKDPSEHAVYLAKEFLTTKYGLELLETEEALNMSLYKKLENLTTDRLKNSELQKQTIERLTSFKDWIIQLKSSLGSKSLEDIINLVKHQIADRTDARLIPNMTLIERAAKAEYTDFANRRRILVGFCIVFYLVGAILILGIIKEQVSSVISAAEWDSISDLFIPH
jgi:hypothetical protein